jgi:hypothetical protein
MVHRIYVEQALTSNTSTERPGWRNPLQAGVVAVLRAAGHEVYDFKNPHAGNHGFHWSDD